MSDPIQLNMSNMPPDDTVNRLVFMMAVINPQNPKQFAGVCFGVSFKVKYIGDDEVELSWLCLRQVQDKNTKDVTIQTPPPAIKWSLSKEQYYGLKPFSKDDYMGPGHIYRIIWLALPEDDIPVNEVSRIIQPNTPPITIASQTPRLVKR